MSRFQRRLLVLVTFIGLAAPTLMAQGVGDQMVIHCAIADPAAGLATRR